MTTLAVTLLPVERQQIVNGHTVITTLFQRDSMGNWPVTDDIMAMSMINKGHSTSQFACVTEIYGEKLNAAFVNWSHPEQSPEEFINVYIASDIKVRIENAQ